MSTRDQVFRTARDYHAALGAYARALRLGHDLEHVAQRVVGAGLAYRRALDSWRAEEPRNFDCERRSVTLRRLLHCTSAKYNIIKRSSPLEALPSD